MYVVYIWTHFESCIHKYLLYITVSCLYDIFSILFSFFTDSVLNLKFLYLLCVPLTWHLLIIFVSFLYWCFTPSLYSHGNHQWSVAFVCRNITVGPYTFCYYACTFIRSVLSLWFTVYLKVETISLWVVALL